MSINHIFKACDSSVDLTVVPTDSTKFYRCGSGILSINSCPTGTVFDNTLKTCTFATSTCSSSVDLTAVPGDTTKFYRCSSGTLFTFSCPGGTVFDATLKICNFASSNVVTVTVAPITAAPVTCTAAQDRTPVDCTSYYTCTNGVLAIATCASGLVFDSTNKVCNVPSNVYGTCGNATASSCPTVDNTPVFTPVLDCTKFYRCFSGVANAIGCQAGLVFDSVNKICTSSSSALGICGTTNGYRKLYYYHAL